MSELRLATVPFLDFIDFFYDICLVTQRISVCVLLQRHSHGRSSHSGASGSFKATETEQTLGSHVVDLNNILGQGAYGIVFLGKHAKTREPVAVKKLITSKEDGGRLALEEIKKYERLPPHPNIVKLLDYHFVDNAFWLVLEFCTDGTLEEFVCK